ncbi:MAG TPA: type I-E CRISPR-associated protein Cas5/CasD [Aggregatilineales bacterium]|nr:type I-E CRISPR-associated protein Cas5/CasD [Chloroflexota bacterium]HOA25396.1 type I-E CRISPR-associated protein Cas5/CasD [Aggregatilineales bacterium]HQA68652.1 type I-E CRISPR-associated protein Cas5/CasD [Aggregatilineales bacterium]HQE17758.1 type I-E CRISPR-associated protein Cas5/CasD [Aggregatilineales bacterium]
MSGTLLLRLSGPMQSWGTQSRFDRRDTGREPSKSGVIGLLCAALGRPRTEPVDDLASLRMGVRVDQPGRVEHDYHTASSDSFYLVSGKSESRTVVSNRYYLADAKFLVGLEGDSGLLAELYAALRDPVWTLYLGRKAFVPGEPVWLPDGLWDGYGLFDALGAYPWLGDPDRSKAPAQLPVFYDDPAGYIVRTDVPLSFAERKFAQRRVSIEYIAMPLPDKEG